MNRSERRVFAQVHKCFPRKRQYVLREAIHTLAQQGVIEYEAAQASPAKSTGNVWLAQEPFCMVTRSPREEDMLDTICQLERQANIFEAAYEALIEDKKELCETLAERAGELNRKNKEILTLRAELDRVHNEHSSDNHNNCKKDTTMATITLDMESMNVDSLGAKMQGVVIRAEVPDNDLPAFLTLVSKLTTNKEPHVCKCEASNGDKRPGTAAKSTAFAPDVD